MALIGLGATSTSISTAIKQPHEFEPIPYRVETFRRMADGSGRKDISASVRRWEIGWRNLTYSQWQALKAYWDVPAAIWLQDLEGSTWRVLVVGDLPSPSRRFVGGTWLYDARMVLEWAGSGAGGIFTIGASTIGGSDVLDGPPGWFVIGASTIGGTGTLAP